MDNIYIMEIKYIDATGRMIPMIMLVRYGNDIIFFSENPLS